MTDVVNVRFRNRGKVYYFDPAGTSPLEGQAVIVETAKGLEYGECTQGVHQVPDENIIPPLRPIVRIATQADDQIAAQNREKDKVAFDVCQEKILEHGLDMKLVDVEYSFEGTKILFFFTSDGRVDFRNLVKDLAAIFRTRIELRQIGVRDGAKMMGGLGLCGRPFCCSTFLDEFQPVSVKMAKTQSLSLNPTKISGTCGRLMCCLKYEQEAYEHLIKNSPKTDTFVDTPMGRGVITDLNLLRQTVKVRLDDPNETLLQVFPLSKLGYTINGEYKKPELSDPETKNTPKPAPKSAPRQPMRERPKDRPANAAPVPAAASAPEEENAAEKRSKRNRRYGKKRRKPNPDKKV